MKKLIARWFTAGIIVLSVAGQNQSLVFASSCHGGHGSSKKEHAPEYTQKTRKPSKPINIIKITSPPKLTIKGTLTCPGDFLYSNKKGYWHDEKKCRSSAVFVKKIDGCDKSGSGDCPYEQKLYHIIYNENTGKLFNHKKYHNSGISISGRLYPDEQVIEVVDYRMLDNAEMREMRLRQKALTDKKKARLEEQKIYTCQMHPNVFSVNPGQCVLCGMDLEIRG